MAVHNYHQQTNALPPHNMFLGPTYGWGYNATWEVFLLPNLEQQPMYNSVNFTVCIDPWSCLSGGGGAMNSTVTYNAIASLLCPSDNQKVRPLFPLAPTNYMGNYGGPDVMRMWSGTIVPFFTCSTTNAQPVAPVGTCWWGADSNLGFFGLEGVTDGSSNTALFSEKLIGYPNGQTPLPFATNSTDAKRGIFLTANIPYTYNSGNMALALQGLQACNALPGTTQAWGTSWFIGWSWAAGYQWNWMGQCYNHYNTPNKLACLNPTDNTKQGIGGYAGISPPTSNHPGGVNMCFADGSVRFVKDSVSPQTFWAIGTRNGGEVVSSDSY